MAEFLSSTSRGSLLLVLVTLFLTASAVEPPAAHGQAVTAADSQWIRPLKPGDPLIWGRKDGVVFGLPSAGGLRGPRGLIRVGVISTKTGKPDLLNFIAVEPVVLGPGSRSSRMAFSELEASQMDPGSRGKRLWVDPGAPSSDSFRGELRTLPNRTAPIERLSVQINVERFTANDAHVYVVASIDSDQPNELRLAVFQYDDSPPLEELTLTATMGNYERLRQLWLKDRIVNSHELYEAYTGDAFVEHENYSLDEMLRTSNGDAITLCTSDEPTPSEVPIPDAESWRYRLATRLTQYWKVPTHDIEPDLRVRMNGRRVYWASHHPVPGGVAFENFEVRQRYKPGQTFIFGVTRNEPQQFEPAIPHLKLPIHSSAGTAEIRPKS
jgi:hypothetical protein